MVCRRHVSRGTYALCSLHIRPWRIILSGYGIPFWGIVKAATSGSRTSTPLRKQISARPSMRIVRGPILAGVYTIANAMAKAYARPDEDASGWPPILSSR